MSQKNIKKQRQEVRRAVRNEFGEGMEALAMIVRKRPRWIPKWVWIWAYVPLFPRKYRGLVYRHMD